MHQIRLPVMQMTSATLKQIREERSWTLREMADFLRDVDGSTLSRWERNPDAEIPSWVAERLLTSVQITLPLTELEEMLDVARAEGLGFAELLATAIREYLAAHQATPPNVTRIQSNGIYESCGSTEPDETARVAEEPVTYLSPE